jgi:hypothetical protein
MEGRAVNRRLVLLGSVAVVMGLVLLLDKGALPVSGSSGRPAPAMEQTMLAAGDVPPGQAILNPLAGLDAASFTAMLDRPLFNPGRAARPPEPPPEPAPPPPVEEPPPELPPAPSGPVAEDFVLVAVSSGPSARIAALRLAATGEVLYLREGQPVQSWNVMAVNERSVVIGTPESNVEIMLFDSGQEEQAPEPMDQAPPPEIYVEPPADMGMDHVSPENPQGVDASQ